MAEESNDNSGTQPITEEIKEYTKSDVNRIVSDRVNELNARKEKAIDEAVQKALKDAAQKQRIESLQGEERIKAEYQAQLDKITAEREAQEEELRTAQRDLAISKAEAQLAGLNLPTEFAINLLGKDDKETTKNIQAFNTKINELVTAKVSESLARGTPKAGGAVAPQQDITMARLREIAHLPPVKG